MLRVLRDNVLIEGRNIEICRDAWIDEYAHIGGGSCFDWQSCLNIGDFLCALEDIQPRSLSFSV